MDLLHHYSSSSASSSHNNNGNGSKEGGQDDAAKSESAVIQALVDAALCPSQAGGVPKRGKVTMVASFGMDDSSLLVRTRPHTPGVWAGHCYCVVRLSKHEQKVARRAVRNVCGSAERAGYTGSCLLHTTIATTKTTTTTSRGSSNEVALHLSLSRPFYLQAANLEPFVRALSNRVHATVQPFVVQLQPPPRHDDTTTTTADKNCACWQLLHNDEGTRSFLVWKVTESVAALLKPLVEQVDTTLAAYEQPAYYDPPVFHVSLASMVPAVVRTTRNDISVDGNVDVAKDGGVADDPLPLPCIWREDEEESDDSSDDDDDSTCTDDFFSRLVTEIYCKFGTTKLFTISLATTNPAY